MNNFMLTFKNKQLEADYQQELKNQIIEFQDHHKWMIILVFGTFLTNSILSENHFQLSIALIGLLLLISRFIFYKRVQQGYDRLLLVFVLLINIEIPLVIFYELDPVRNCYIHGYYIAFLTLVLLRMMNVYFQIFAIVGIYIINISFTMSKLELWYQVVQYFTFSLLVVLSSLYYEKFSRCHYFQLKLSEQISNSVLQHTDADVYVCSFKEKLNALLLIQSNGLTNITRHIQQQFTELIRDFKFRGKRHLKGVLKKQFTLEQYLFQLYQQPLDSILSHELVGNKEQEQFKIQVVEYLGWERVVIVIINENKKANQIEELSLRNRELVKGLDSFVNIFRSEIRLSLVHFHWIYNLADKRTESKQINLSLKSIQSRLTKAYNDCLNLVEFLSVDHQISSPSIRQFDLIKLINQTLRMVQLYNGQFTYSCEFNLIDTKIRSNQCMIQQLLVNLLFFMKVGSHEVKIVVESLEELNQELIKIKLYYQGPTLSQKYLKSLPIMNPQCLSERRHNCNHKLELELAISLLIINKLGPNNEIILQQSANSLNTIEFLLFRNYSNEFQIMCQKSLTPYNHIITEQIQTQSHHHNNYRNQYFNLPSPKMELFTNRSGL